MTRQDLRFLGCLTVVVLALIGSCPFLIPEPEVIVVAPTPRHEDVTFDYTSDVEEELEAQRQRQAQQDRELEAIQAALSDVAKVEAAGPDAPPPQQLDYYRKGAQDREPVQKQPLRKRRRGATTEPEGHTEVGDGEPDG